MYYDLVPIKSKYRGMGRILLATDLLTPKTEKVFEQLLEKYYAFLDCSELFTENNFERTVKFYKQLKDYDIPCEIIVYNDEPIEELFSYPINWLGIDIVHEMRESLLKEETNYKILDLINENGLCRCVADVEQIIPYQDHGNVTWVPCYVYSVIVDF